MEIKVFKFGGASVNSADGVRNVATIVEKYAGNPLLLVVSAMGKTTNALEEILRNFRAGDAVAMVESFYRLRDYHLDILHELFSNKESVVFGEIDALFEDLRSYLKQGSRRGYDFEYDQLVCFGELFSSCILCHYLTISGFPCRLFDARELIKTDSTYRDARVDWSASQSLIKSKIQAFFNSEGAPGIALTQGFIGGDAEGHSTTLGREGSDYSAAIFAYALKTKEVTIWKDVPGVLNADPKWFKNPQKLDRLSYREAIELAYFGASVIHPKTIKPLENANIVLFVKNFRHPDGEGTRIENIHEWVIKTPIYIRKQNQVLISISPRDFSFIIEENLGQIFTILAGYRIRVNVMQNSAISFSICIDRSEHALEPLIQELSGNYSIRYNYNVELYTIRHYNTSAITRITKNKTVLLEQKTRNTVHLVVI